MRSKREGTEQIDHPLVIIYLLVWPSLHQSGKDDLSRKNVCPVVKMMMMTRGMLKVAVNLLPPTLCLLLIIIVLFIVRRSLKVDLHLTVRHASQMTLSVHFACRQKVHLHWLTFSNWPPFVHWACPLLFYTVCWSFLLMILQNVCINRNTSLSIEANRFSTSLFQLYLARWELVVLN